MVQILCKIFTKNGICVIFKIVKFSIFEGGNTDEKFSKERTLQWIKIRIKKATYHSAIVYSDQSTSGILE